MTQEENSTLPPDDADLEELIKSPTSRATIQPPSWLSNLSKERVEDFLVSRIVDNLSTLIPDAVVELTSENQLTENKISEKEECKEAIKNRKREFTFELETQNLPPFHPWVEFTPKISGMGFPKLRFEYIAQPEIAAEGVRVTLLDGRLSEVSIKSLKTKIDMSIVANGLPAKLGTIERTLRLNQKFR